MNLLDLFENDIVTNLEPGEKKYHSDLTIDNLQKIDNKISKLMIELGKLEVRRYEITLEPGYYTGLYDELIRLQNRIKLKIHYLRKMKVRPQSSPQKMIEILNRDCSEFVTIVKETKHFLYRGMHYTENVIEGRTRLDRSPMTSDTDLSNRFDQILQKYGFKALRSNSIFVTSSQWLAGNFGRHVYIIFPKNGFDFTYTNTKDLILTDIKDLVDLRDVSNFTRRLKSWVKSNVPYWDNSYLGKALISNNWREVFDRLHINFNLEKNYYNLPKRFNKTAIDFVNDQKIIDRYDIKQTNLEIPMKNGNEILIHGEYWALRCDHWEHFLMSNFFT